MGAGQSTRSIPDYTYVIMYVDNTEYIHVRFLVYNTENALKIRMIMREQDNITFKDLYSKL